MISSSNLIHLPYTRDLTEGGIAYALRTLPYTFNRAGGSPYDRLRRTVASAAVELAFRRYLAEQNVPFEVKGPGHLLNPSGMMCLWAEDDVTSSHFSSRGVNRSKR